MNETSQVASAKDRWSGFLKSPIDWLLICGILGLAPLIWSESKSLWSMKHYQFFPLAWAAFAAVLYLRGNLADSQVKLRRGLGWLFLVGTLIFTVLAVVLDYPKLAQVSAIGLILGWMMLRLGRNPWFECFAWITLLLITVRLPLTLDQTLIHTLQRISSQSASQLLDLTGIPHLATGNVIEIKPGKLFVEEACSGVDSFYALAAVALMLAIWQQRGLAVSLLTIASVPLWAWFGNVIRLYLLAFLYNNYNYNLTEGWAHTAFGLVIFAIAFGGLLSMQEALTRLLAPLPGSSGVSDWAPRFYNWLVTWPDRDALPGTAKVSAGGGVSGSAESANRRGMLSLVVSGVGILTFLVGGVITAGPVLGIGSKRSKVTATFDRGEVDVTFAADNLPENFGGMQRKNFEISHRERSSMFGAHSATWIFQDQSREVVLSLDFAFTVFHQLEACYISTGSTVLGDIQQYMIPAETGPQYISEVNLRDLFGEQSYLNYTEFNDEGVSVERAEIFSLQAFLNKGLFEKSIGPLFQLQILVSDAATLKDEEKERYRTILNEARQLLLPKVHALSQAE